MKSDDTKYNKADEIILQMSSAEQAQLIFSHLVEKLPIEDIIAYFENISRINDPKERKLLIDAFLNALQQREFNPSDFESIDMTTIDNRLREIFNANYSLYPNF